MSSGTRASVWRLRTAPRVAAGQVGAAAALEEEGVAGHEPAVDEEALAARRVAGRVDQLDRDLADQHHVAAVVADEVGAADPGGALAPTAPRPPARGPAPGPFSSMR